MHYTISAGGSTIEMTDEVISSMLSNEDWRKMMSALCCDLLEEIKCHGFSPKYDLLVNDIVGLMNRASYMAGWRAALNGQDRQAD